MKFNKLILVLFTLSFFVSCGNKYVLSPDKLEDVLVDLHLAEGIVMQNERSFISHEDKVSLYGYVYEKHGIDKARFDSTMTYYAEDLSTLEEVYVNVEKRISELMKSVDKGDYAVSLTEIPEEQNARIVSEDMALLPFVNRELWFGARTIDFKTKDYKGRSFIINLDTLYESKMTLRFTAVNDSMRSAQCVLTMKYADRDEEKVFDVTVDSSQLVSLEWEMAEVPKALTFVFKAEPINSKSTMQYRDFRLYEMATEVHDIHLLK